MNSKPFIKLYRSPRCFYFYDVNKDSVVEVNKEIYDYLNDKKAFEELSADNQKFIEALKVDGYLSFKHYSIIEHPAMGQLEYDLSRRCSQLILQVTQACNLVCYYCPYANKTGGAIQRDHSSKMMTWETAKKAIDFYYDKSIDCVRVSMSFYGGEPLIAFDLVKKCVEYANEKFLGKEIVYNLTTNATLLTEDMIDFFYKHDFNLLFSIDGPEEIHDINRRKYDGTGSFKEAFANLGKVAEKYGDKAKGKISINTVINPVNDLDLLLSLYDDELFSKYDINIQMTLADDLMLDKKIEVTDVYREKICYQYFLGWLDALKIVKGLKLTPSVASYVSLLPREYFDFKKVRAGLSDVGAPAGPCVPGQRRMFVNADEKIFPCERVSEVINEMCIGNLDDGFDLKKASDLLNIGTLTSEKCKNCYASSACQLCGKDCVSENGYDAEVKVKNCKRVCSSFDSSINSMIIMKESRTIYKRRAY